MQLPNTKTSHDTCIRCALYTEAMAAKHASNAAIAAAVPSLSAARMSLAERQTACDAAELELIGVRVEVKYVDSLADGAVRDIARRAEVADGGKGGRIGTALFPGGATPIVKPVGSSEVKELRALEGRLEACASLWPEALPKKAELSALRQRYEAALEARAGAMAALADRRALRDAAKEDFVEVFAVVAARVQGEFPRNRALQDLFFDEVTRARSTAEVEDVAATAIA